MDYLQAKGWAEVSHDEVDAGVVCAVDGVVILRILGVILYLEYLKEKLMLIMLLVIINQ